MQSELGSQAAGQSKRPSLSIEEKAKQWHGFVDDRYEADDIKGSPC